MSKVSLAGNASGTGIFTIASPNSNTDRTLTLPDNTGTLLTSGSAIQKSQLPTGSVLQVVQAVLTSSVTFTSATVVATGLSASITPLSASSKILILLTGGRFDYAGGGPSRGNIYLYKNASSLVYFGSIAVGNPTWSLPYSESYLDSPATTSAITYAIYGANDASAATNFLFNNTLNGRATLTLMEIAG
jgi:hypothetical protein